MDLLKMKPSVIFHTNMLFPLRSIFEARTINGKTYLVGTGKQFKYGVNKPAIILFKADGTRQEQADETAEEVLYEASVGDFIGMFEMNEESTILVNSYVITEISDTCIKTMPARMG